MDSDKKIFFVFKARISVYELASDYDVTVDFLVDSTSLTTSFQKVQCHDDLIKTHPMRWGMFIRSTCNNAINMRGN